MKNYDVLIRRASADTYDVILRNNQFVGSITIDNLPVHYTSGGIESGLAVSFTIDADGYFSGRSFGEAIEGKLGIGWSVEDVLKTINSQARPGIAIGINATTNKQIYTPLEQGIMTGMGISGLYKNMMFDSGMDSGLAMSFTVNDSEISTMNPIGDFAHGIAIGMSVSGDAIKDTQYYIKPSLEMATDMSVGDIQTTIYEAVDGPIAIGVVGESILRRYRKVNEMTEPISAYADMPMSELIYITIAE